MAAAFIAGGLLVVAYGQTDWQDIVKLDFGACDAALTNIENQVSHAMPAQYAAFEEKLLAVLGDSAATFPAKQFVCRMLRVVGSKKSVAPLAQLLGDDQLSHAARYALEGIGGDAPDAALRDAFAKTSGKIRIGIIGSLAARGDRKAVKDIGALVDGNDVDTSRAAIKALGRIGTAEAAQELSSHKYAKAAETCWFSARLACAGNLAKTGEKKTATGIYNDVLAKAELKQMRIGAFLGLVRLDPVSEVPRVMAALKGDDPVLGQAVVPALLALDPKAVIPELAKELPALSAAKKIVALRALSAIKGATPLGDSFNALINDASPAVQLAAVEAAVQLGNAQNVAVLAAKLATDDDVGKAAKQTLTDLQRDGVAAEIVKAAGGGDPKLRVTLLGILSDRRNPAVLPALYKLTADENAKVRHAATKSIGTLGGADDVTKLVELLLTSKDSGDRGYFASATSAIAVRQPDVNTRSAAIIAGLTKADADGKVLLLGVLSALGGKPAYEAVHGYLASAAADIKKAAVEAFTEWPDASPLDDLKAVVKSDASDVNRILAMRGYIRLLAESNIKNNKRVEACKEMYALATRPQEKYAVFAGLGDSPSVQALQFLEGHLGDADVKAEALATYERVAEQLIKPKAKEARAALERVIALTDDKNLRRRAEGAIKRIK